jgi:hypothetical protein
MDLLDWRYAGPHKENIELTADLDGGWGLLEKKGPKPAYRGYDKQRHLPDRSEPRFWCRLYVVALLPATYQSARTFPGTVASCKLGRNSVSIKGSRMEVEIPLSHNTWRPTHDSGRMGIYEIGDPLFSIATPDGAIGFRVQLWLVHYAPLSMFVGHQYEWGGGFVLIGGRPESNRRKF